MATIIPFTPRQRRQRKLQETARILLFSGVRYERWTDDKDAPMRKPTAAQPKNRNRTSRKRA